MSRTQQKLTEIMDSIQAWVESTERERDCVQIEEWMRRAGIYTAHMTDEDRDYYQYVQWLLEEEQSE